MGSNRANASDKMAMDILSQLERLKATAEGAGETALALRVGSLLDDYLTRYCDSKRAALDEWLHRQPPHRDHFH